MPQQVHVTSLIPSMSQTYLHNIFYNKLPEFHNNQSLQRAVTLPQHTVE